MLNTALLPDAEVEVAAPPLSVPDAPPPSPSPGVRGIAGLM